MIIKYICSKKGGFVYNSVVLHGENKHIEKIWVGLHENWFKKMDMSLRCR